MVVYGVKYQCEFDPVGPASTDPVYTIQILQKDWDAAITSLKGGAIPALHQWQTDDPKAAVKGSSLALTLINEGTFPLESIYSSDDEQFKVRFLFGPQLLFEGFIVQDDCSEIMVDFTHEINLSATDNLALIKSVALDKAPANYAPVFSSTSEYFATAPHTLWVDTDFALEVLVGDQVQIGTDFYTVTDNSGGNLLIVNESIPTIAGTTGLLILLRSSLLDKITLATVIKTCLLATGLRLNTYIWGRIREVSQNDLSSFIDQTLIDPQTFITGTTPVTIPIGNTTVLSNAETYQDCNTVLTEILGRFNMTLFQARGTWNIVRWDELRYYQDAMTAYVYDPDFNLINSAVMDAPFTAGIGETTFAETGLLKKISRPFSFDLETFNYKQPVQLLRNYDLQTLGVLLNTYRVTIWITTDGVIHYSDPGLGGGPGVVISFQTYSEYAAPWWYYEDVFPSASGVNGPAIFFIRIISDTIGNEVNRYMVIKNNHIHSYKVEANQGDEFKFSFSFRTPDNDFDTAHFVLIIKLTNGITTLYAKAPLDAGQTIEGWGPALGFGVDISGDTKLSFNSVTAQSRQVPFDGLLTFYLQTQALHASDETQYKDISLDYSFVINDSIKIIGQTHKTSQVGVIKQNESIEIFCDSSPRNSIAGTLFLNTMVGLIQARTSRWTHPYLTQNKLLGDLITWEQMFWRQKPRTILDGTFYGLINSGNHVSMLNVFLYTGLAGLHFAAGMMEIDYKNNKFTGTIWEIWQGTGTNCKLYSFAFLETGEWYLSGINCDGTTFVYSSTLGGVIPGPICARVNSITALNITVTEGADCGTYAGELDTDILLTYLFTYLYSPI